MLYIYTKRTKFLHNIKYFSPHFVLNKNRKKLYNGFHKEHPSKIFPEVLKLEPFIGDIGVLFLLILGIMYHQWDNMFRE